MNKKIKVVITTTMEMTREQYESDKVQDVLKSINNGEIKRDMNDAKAVDKITITYWTNAKQVE